MSDDNTPIKLGKFEIKKPTQHDTRFSALIWGDAGVGKTTLAATAPGKKLWLLFDPDGDMSLVGYDDVLVLNLAGEGANVVEEFKKADPFGIEKVLRDHPEIETVVFDSASSFTQVALTHAVNMVNSKIKGGTPASLEAPGKQGYGYRTTYTIRALTVFMQMTKRLNRHYIVIAHEAMPATDDGGNVIHITLTLGGQIPNLFGLQMSEIWWMSVNTRGERSIAYRAVRMRKPIKSRLFIQSAGSGEFRWQYDPVTRKGDGIASWFKAWQANGGKPIPPPA